MAVAPRIGPTVTRIAHPLPDTDRLADVAEISRHAADRV